MPYYMVQLSYTQEAVGNLVQNSQNRIEAVRPAFEELGVTIRDSYLAFGEYALSSSRRHQVTCKQQQSLWRSRREEG